MTAEQRVCPASIVADTAALYGLSVDAIMGHTRGHDDLPEARWVIMAVLERLGYCVAEIGRAMDRDHSTILHGLARVHADADMTDLATSIAPCPHADDPVTLSIALTMLTLPERRAVGRYLTLLLSDRPTGGMEWTAGLWLLARHPDALEALAASLVNVGRDVGRAYWRDSVAGITQRITYHLHAAGYVSRRAGQ